MAPELLMSGLKMELLSPFLQIQAFLLVETLLHSSSSSRSQTGNRESFLIKTLQIHYVNTSHTVDSSGVNIHFSPERPRYSAGVLSVLLSPAVPAGAEVVVEGGCQLGQDKTLQLLYFLGHTHSLAKVRGRDSSELSPCTRWSLLGGSGGRRRRSCGS